MRRYARVDPLLACGVVGPVLFIAVFTIDGAMRAGYDPGYHPVSALSLGARGWLQITNFVVSGLLIIAFAVGLRRGWRPGPGAWWTPALIGMVGLGLVLSGVFVMDPMRGYPPGTGPADPSRLTWQHTLHDVFGIVVFLALPVACFVAARRFAGRPARWGWALYSGLSGVAGLVSIVVFSVVWETDAPVTGVVQRVMIMIDWSWLVMLAVAVGVRRAPSGPADRWVCYGQGDRRPGSPNQIQGQPIA